MTLLNNKGKAIIGLVLVISLASCSENTDKVETNSNETNINLAKKTESWIVERVSKAEATLNATEAGKLVWQSMEAHGGLKKWFQNGPISFRFDYVPVSGKSAKKTIQQIDTWSNRAVHQSVLDNEDTFGWDGTNAWYKRNDTNQFNYDLRFWALTPYYFEGQPFIFDGEGVKLEKLDDQKIDEETFTVVKISFEAGTGDAPDDYYINYYDKNTHLLKAIKYIVSYPKRFKNGGHSPEKLMLLTAYHKTNGITLAKSFETYSTDEQGNKNELVTKVTVSEINFMPDLDDSYFNMPTNSKIVE